MKRLVLLVLMVLVAVPAWAAGNEYRIGDTRIVIPAPDGYVATSEDATLDSAMATFTAKTNAYLVGFLTKEDFDGFRAGAEQDLFERYYLIQTFKALMDKKLRVQDFTTLRNQLRRQIDSSLAQMDPNKDLRRASADFEEKFGVAMEASVSGVVPLGVQAESERSICFAMVQRVNMKVENRPYEYIVLCVGDMMLVRGKLIYVYYYTPWEGKQSLDPGVAAVREMERLLLANNP